MPETSPGEIPLPTPEEEEKERERYLRSKEGHSDEEIRKKKEMMEEEGKHLSKEYKESREGELTVRLTREEAIKISDAVGEILNNFHGLRSGSATPEQEKAYWQRRDEWLSLEKKLKDLVNEKS